MILNETKQHTLRGVLCTTLGGVCWGFSGTCGQYLFSNFGIDSLWLTCVRLLTSGILLLTIAFWKHGKSVCRIWTVPKDAFQLVCYGIFGLLLCQYSYMTAISWSNAATTTVLQNLSLVLIMLFACVSGRRLPVRREVIALLLAVLGTWIIATGFDPRHMVLSHQGLFWGLMTAVAVAVYSILPRKLLPRWGKEAVTGWGMLVGGIVVNLAAHSWNYHVELPVQGWLAMASVILLGSVLAFTLFMQGVADVGPVRSAMLAATEPVAATVFSALWLHTQFTALDLLGFACIITTIFLLAKDGN